MIRGLLVLLALLLSSPAQAATDLFLFYGAGPHGLSSGIDRIARIARTFGGVGFVGTFDYRDTQAAYDRAAATPPSDKIVLVGFSCGAQSVVNVAAGLERNHRPVVILAIQPSFWCGSAQTTSNVVYAQDSWSPGTFGLGSKWYDGSASRIVLIERRSPHLQGDDNPAAQADVLAAIYSIANNRPSVLGNHLGRTTRFVRTNGQTTWLEGN